MFRIMKSESFSNNVNVGIAVILERPYAFLESQLIEVFEGQSEVMIIVDRRFGERRQNEKLFSPDRRHADRRMPQQEIGKAIISV